METLTNNLRDKNKQYWFVIGSRNHMKELQIRDEARNKGLEAFVPVIYAYKVIRGQKQRKLIPAINGFVFVKATTTEMEELILKSKFTIYPKKSSFSGREEFLTIANRDMENFIAVIEKSQENITYFKPDEIPLNPGDRIRIQGGLYDGREGIIMRIKSKRNKHLVVQIPGLLVAAVELKPELVAINDNGKMTNDKRGKREDIRERPSKDLDKDRKMVFDIAHRLLFEFPDKYKNEEEYYLLINQLQRGLARIQTFKGYVPSTEAELALAIFLAQKALGEDTTLTQKRLDKAISRLKNTSKLKSQALEIMIKI
jgi:transcription antitermination factor NusG